MKKFVEEFKEFIARGNALQMAIGVVIGGAFGAITNSLVADVITPLLAATFKSPNTDALNITLRAATADSEAIVLGLGTFVGAVINFLVIALVIFSIMKAANKAAEMAKAAAKKKEEEAPAEEEEPKPTTEELLTAILEEMKKHFRETYHYANELFLSFRNEESYLHLEQVYTALILAIENSDFGREKIGRRAAIEVRCACLDRAAEMDGVSVGMMKRRVVEYNELSQQIQDLNLPDDAPWPEDWTEMLECVEIPKAVFTAMPARRAYDLSKKSCELSRKICGIENSPGNLDALAVSLSKFLQVCMLVDLKEFAQVNRELESLAHELYQMTGREKYAMMLMQAQMGEHLTEGTESDFLDGFLGRGREKTGSGAEKNAPSAAAERKPHTEKELRDTFRSVRRREETETDTSRDAEKTRIEKRIRELERRIALLVGPLFIVRRREMKREVEELRKKLSKIG